MLHFLSNRNNDIILFVLFESDPEKSFGLASSSSSHTDVLTHHYASPTLPHLHRITPQTSAVSGQQQHSLVLRSGFSPQYTGLVTGGIGLSAVCAPVPFNKRPEVFSANSSLRWAGGPLNRNPNRGS